MKTTTGQLYQTYTSGIKMSHDELAELYQGLRMFITMAKELRNPINPYILANYNNIKKHINKS